MSSPLAKSSAQTPLGRTGKMAVVQVLLLAQLAVTHHAPQKPTSCASREGRKWLLRVRSSAGGLQLRGGIDFKGISDEWSSDKDPIYLDSEGKDVGVDAEDDPRVGGEFGWPGEWPSPVELRDGSLVPGGVVNISGLLPGVLRRDGDVMGDLGPGGEHRKPYRFKAEYEDLPPSHTLYVRNLREKVSWRRMRDILHAAFAPYGDIIYLRVLQTKTHRGQAFVCFRELASATRARETLDGYSFLNRTLVVRYAKSKSHALMKLDGTYPDLLRKASPPSRPRPPSPPAAPLSSRRGEQCGGRQVREDFLDAERTAAEERAAQEAALLAPRAHALPAGDAARPATPEDAVARARELALARAGLGEARAATVYLVVEGHPETLEPFALQVPARPAPAAAGPRARAR